jgi:hypothetical protein
MRFPHIITFIEIQSNFMYSASSNMQPVCELLFSRCIPCKFAYLTGRVHFLQVQVCCSKANHTTDITLHRAKLYFLALLLNIILKNISKNNCRDLHFMSSTNVLFNELCLQKLVKFKTWGQIHYPLYPSVYIYFIQRISNIYYSKYQYNNLIHELDRWKKI